MSHTPLRTIAARIAPVLLLAGLMAGCGDDGDKSSKDDETDNTSQTSSPATEGTEGSADTSDDTGTATATELTKDNILQTLLAAQKDAGSLRSKQTSQTAAGTLEYEGEISYDGGQANTHVKTTPASAQQIEMYLVDGVAYVKGDGLGASDKWIKVDTKDPANQSGVLAPLALGADPDAALQAFGNPTSVELVGPETVEGVETNHYKVTVSTQAYADALGLPDELAGLMPPEITQDIWIDDQNRQIKTSSEVTVQGQKTVTEQVFYDYGADVTVTAPADSDTITPQEAGIPGY